MSLTMRLMMDFAIKDSIDKIKEMGKETREGTEKSKVSVQKLAQSFSVLGSLTGGVFAQMTGSSAELAIAMAEIDYAMIDVYRTLGDALAPIIEETIIPIIETLVELFMSLPAEVQTSIALIIGITTALGSLAPVIMGVASLMNPVGLTIMAVILAIGLLYLAWETNFLGIRDIVMDIWTQIEPMFMGLIETIMEIGASVSRIWEIISPTVTAIADIWMNVFGNLIQNYIETAIGAIQGFLTVIQGVFTVIEGILTLDMEMIGAGFIEIMGGLAQALWNIFIQPMIDAFQYVFDFIGAIFLSIGELISSIFGESADSFFSFIDLIKSLLNVPIQLVNDLILKPINDFLTTIIDLDILGVKPFEWVSTIPYIPLMHGGGIVGQEGTTSSGDVLRTLQVGEGVVKKDDMRRLASSGGREIPKPSNITVIVQGNVMDRQTIQKIAKEVSLVNERSSQLKVKY